jgi:hypothetical protein
MNKRTEKPEHLTPIETPTINQVADADLAALGAAGQEMTAGEFVGTRMNYAKGKWTKIIIQDEQKTAVQLPATASYIVDPLSVAFAWKKWIDKKIAGPPIGPGRPIDGFVLPLREQLGDLDENKWPLRNGKREDPWQSSTQITMKDADNGELYTWVTASWGGRRAVGSFLKTFNREARKHPGQYPKVILGTRGEPSPDYGTIDKPVFKVVDWAVFGEGAAPPGMPLQEPQQLPSQQTKLIAPAKSKSTDIDDEIPF